MVIARATTFRRTRTGYIKGTYSPDEVDVIAGYCADLKRCFAVPITHFGRSGYLQLRLSPARNGQLAGLHFAGDYPLGAIAQLEERVSGTHEVAGSSPASSTIRLTLESWR